VALAAACGYLAASGVAHAGAVEVLGAAADTAVPTQVAPAAAADPVAQPVSETGEEPSGPAALVSPQYQAQIADTSSDFASRLPIAAEAGAGTPQAPRAARRPAAPVARAVAGDRIPLSRPRGGAVTAATAQAGTRAAQPVFHPARVKKSRATAKRYHAHNYQYQLKERVSRSGDTLWRTATARIAVRWTLFVSSYLRSDHVTNLAPTTSRSPLGARLFRTNQIFDQTKPTDPPLISPAIGHERTPASTLRAPATSAVTYAQRSVRAPRGQKGTSLAAGQLADARRLVQLGLVLGMAYALFLVLWFWRTWDRRHRLGRAVRF
jgi:hypothetical protein